MTIDIDKLEAAAKAATQDEWEFWNGYVATDIDSDGGVIICNRPTPSGGKFQKQIDANFKYIATANPQAVLELIARLREAEKDASKWRESKRTSYNPDYPWRPLYIGDKCPACFEHFDLDHKCGNCGSGYEMKESA